MKPQQYCAALLLLSVGLFGCKPKETTLSGQIFIVTRGAENIRLGGVHVQLMERRQVVKFLERKQRAVETEVASRKHEVDIAQKELEHAQNDYNQYLTSRPFLTNSEYLEIQAKRDGLLREVNVLKQKAYSNLAESRQLEEAAKRAEKNNSRADGERIVAKSRAIAVQTEQMAKQVERQVDEMNALNVKLREIEQRGKSKESAKVETAESRLTITKIKLEEFPAIEFYFESFPTNALQETVSDADGRFSITFPRRGTFTIVAKGQRAMFDKTEKYYWLVNAPNSEATAQIVMSNNNLLETDPDAYFKSKPKPAIGELLAP